MNFDYLTNYIAQLKKYNIIIFNIRSIKMNSQLRIVIKVMVNKIF